tara:strand:- start:644 stop:886 length:243 start_codon:yes stop_codon:yes gene_type:complete
MFVNRFILLLLISLALPVYQVGDQISAEDQARNFDVCYGAEHHGIEEQGGRYRLGLGDYNGYTNDSGIFYVMMIDMAASW